MSEQSEQKDQSKTSCVTESKTEVTIPAFAPFKIYLLKRIFVAGHDEFNGKVIIASSAKAARKIANLKTGDEGKIWDNVNQVMCKEIMLTEAAIVLEDFNNGYA